MAGQQEDREGASTPPALALMTDSSEEEEEIERERSELLGERHSGPANHSSSGDRPNLAAPRKRRGRLLKMPFSKNKSVWFVWDPCGIICAVMTYMLIFYGELVLLMVVAPPFPDMWTVLNGLVFTGLVGLSVVAHVKAMITDPVREEEEEKGMRGRGITRGGGGDRHQRVAERERVGGGRGVWEAVVLLCNYLQRTVA